MPPKTTPTADRAATSPPESPSETLTPAVPEEVNEVQEVTAQVVDPHDRWPNTMTIRLPSHVAHLRRLMYEARMSGKEYRWYNPYSYALNFNCLRSSTETCIFSVWPQASLQWTGPSYRIADIPDDVDNQDYSQQENVESLEDTHLSAGDSTAPDGADLSGTPADENSSHGMVLRPRKPKEPSQQDATPDSPPQRPPDSTSSTASVPDSRTNYADHAVLMSSFKFSPDSQKNPKSSQTRTGTKSCNSELPDNVPTVESVHSVWELKCPTFKEPYDSPTHKRRLARLACSPAIVRQLLQEAQGAFAQYKHQDTMYVFLGLGYWIKKCTMERNNMPKDNFDWDNATTPQLVQHYKISNDFALLNPDKTDYNPIFKRYWTNATNEATDAADRKLSRL
ncbi:hypothetical protein EIP86_005184 [Pleurotus ostreatoroseus]|nr:hypothetical protein EIP86_005184 [Pleurotus ostreatoroseus]